MELADTVTHLGYRSRHIYIAYPQTELIVQNMKIVFFLTKFTYQMMQTQGNVQITNYNM